MKKWLACLLVVIVLALCVAPVFAQGDPTFESTLGDLVTSVSLKILICFGLVAALIALCAGVKLGYRYLQRAVKSA